MCVAEALLHPGQETADKLISDKLAATNWETAIHGQKRLGAGQCRHWGLMLTGKLVTLAEETQRNFVGALKRLIGAAASR